MPHNHCLLSIKYHLFHNFNLFCSNNPRVFQKTYAEMSIQTQSFKEVPVVQRTAQHSNSQWMLSYFKTKLFTLGTQYAQLKVSTAIFSYTSCTSLEDV
jgi:hypothetical protein